MKRHFKVGDIVKYSRYYFAYMRNLKFEGSYTFAKFKDFESGLLFKIVEIPAQHGEKRSIGIRQINSRGRLIGKELIACTRKELVVVG